MGQLDVKQNMNSLVLTLDPKKLRNPDLDLRYVVPDLLTVRSNGNVRDNGYDYEEATKPLGGGVYL